MGNVGDRTMGDAIGRWVKGLLAMGILNYEIVGDWTVIDGTVGD